MTEDDALLASLIACSSSTGMGVDDSLICISPDSRLMLLEPMESIALDGDICIAHKVLEQSTAMEEMVEFARTNLHQISVAWQVSG